MLITSEQSTVLSRGINKMFDGRVDFSFVIGEDSVDVDLMGYGFEITMIKKNVPRKYKSLRGWQIHEVPDVHHFKIVTYTCDSPDLQSGGVDIVINEVENWDWVLGEMLAFIARDRCECISHELAMQADPLVDDAENDD